MNNETRVINPNDTALLLLHWQNDMAAPTGKLSKNLPGRLAANLTVQNTRAILKASREAGMIVIYINASHRPGYPEIRSSTNNIVIRSGGLVRGSWGADVIEELKPVEGDIVIFNYSQNAFSYTELDLILRNKAITNLVLSGLVTNWSIESTARDAVARGYTISTISDCCQSFSDEMHNWSVANVLTAIGSVFDAKTYINILGNKF
jgi:nicotinamidase-related amidase